MSKEYLERALLRSAHNDAWVEILAEYFSRHDLSYGHGTDNAADEAYWLVGHLRAWREDGWAAPPDSRLAARAAELAVRRVETRLPLAYLINEAWFAGLRFYVDRRVLVPRSPCAEIIERRFEPWLKIRNGDRVLDVGTGSGCIAIAVAHHCPAVIVDATDVSGDALKVARRNVETHGLGGRVNLFEADLFASDRGPYRVIIANLPYVPARELEYLPQEYRHEPRAGLVGGASGLEPTLRLLGAARDFLDADGALIVEVGNGADALASALPDWPFIWLELERGGKGVFLLWAEALQHLGAHESLVVPVAEHEFR
jgi:ribosomal protein L3 glutamine methyltransferase